MRCYRFLWPQGLPHNDCKNILEMFSNIGALVSNRDGLRCIQANEQHKLHVAWHIQSFKYKKSKNFFEQQSFH